MKQHTATCLAAAVASVALCAMLAVAAYSDFTGTLGVTYWGQQWPEVVTSI